MTSIQENKEPKIGDTKISKGWALFPVKVEGRWIWLKKYTIIWMFKPYQSIETEVIKQGIIWNKERDYSVVANCWVQHELKIINKKSL